MTRFPAAWIVAAAWLGIALAPSRVDAVCIPFPCDDCTLQSAGQITLVSMDRIHGRVILVPNIRLVGRAEDFALVVPTPALPELTAASADLWTQSFALTAGIFTGSRGGDSFGCGVETVASPTSFEDDAVGGEGDVIVHGRETVGAMEAVILSSEDSTALATWLRDNGFPFTEEDAVRFAPYAARGWFFTAMRPADPSSTPRNWNSNVDPVAFSYAADTFEIPMPLLGGPNTNTMAMGFFVVDDYRTEFPGLNTLYANRITESEYLAIRGRHPALAVYLAPGRVLTRMDRMIDPQDDFSAGIALLRAADQSEVRRVNGVVQRAAIPGFLVLTGALSWIAAQWAGRERRRTV